MTDLLRATLEFPTAIFTVLMAVAMLYWLMVIAGALDIDVIGGGDVDVDLGVDAGGADAGGGDAGDADVGSGGGSFLSALGLTKVPLTISLTALFFLGWLICLFGMHYLGDLIGLPRWVIGLNLLALALLLAPPLAGLLVRPLAPVFHVHKAKTRADWVGSVCTITTGRVDADFGQATIEQGGDVLVIPVRCDKPGALGRHHKALVIDYDEARQAYLVEPVEGLLESKKEN